MAGCWHKFYSLTCSRLCFLRSFVLLTLRGDVRPGPRAITPSFNVSLWNPTWLSIKPRGAFGSGRGQLHLRRLELERDFTRPSSLPLDTVLVLAPFWPGFLSLFSNPFEPERGKKKNPQNSEPKGVDSKPSLAAESRLGQVTGPLGHLFFRRSVRAACAPSIGCLRKPRRKHLTNYNVLWKCRLWSSFFCLFHWDLFHDSSKKPFNWFP